jgi:hypothetical protein
MFNSTTQPPTKTTEALEILQRYGAEYFDGHTEFHRLTAQQRLAWLDEAVGFINEAKNVKRSALTSSLTSSIS